MTSPRSDNYATLEEVLARIHRLETAAAVMARVTARQTVPGPMLRQALQGFAERVEAEHKLLDARRKLLS